MQDSARPKSKAANRSYDRDHRAPDPERTYLARPEISLDWLAGRIGISSKQLERDATRTRFSDVEHQLHPHFARSAPEAGGRAYQDKPAPGSRPADYRDCTGRGLSGSVEFQPRLSRAIRLHSYRIRTIHSTGIAQRRGAGSSSGTEIRKHGRVSYLSRVWFPCPSPWALQR